MVYLYYVKQFKKKEMKTIKFIFLLILSLNLYAQEYSILSTTEIDMNYDENEWLNIELSPCSQVCGDLIIDNENRRLSIGHDELRISQIIKVESDGEIVTFYILKDGKSSYVSYLVYMRYSKEYRFYFEDSQSKLVYIYGVKKHIKK